MSDKVDFRANDIARDKEGHFLMIKGSIHQEGIATLNIYVPNSKASNVRKAKIDRAAKKEIVTLQL